MEIARTAPAYAARHNHPQAPLPDRSMARWIHPTIGWSVPGPAGERHEQLEVSAAVARTQLRGDVGSLGACLRERGAEHLREARLAQLLRELDEVGPDALGPAQQVSVVSEVQDPEVRVLLQVVDHRDQL